MDYFEKNRELLDSLEVGVSITTWHPEAPGSTEWVFVNKKRCQISGFSREEILAQPPVGQLTRETRAQFDRINAALLKDRHFNCESTLRHKSNKAIPVQLHIKLVELDGVTVLLTEQHDIRSYKETESLLRLSRESMREMLTLIEKEKEKISDNIKSNFRLVLFPLIDQMRITATAEQKEVLDLMVDRIGHIAREIGVAEASGTFGVNLTKRQILICEMIRDGMSSKEIAQALGCTASTINNHRNIIRRKLGLSGKSSNLQAFLNSPGSGSG